MLGSLKKFVDKFVTQYIIYPLNNRLHFHEIISPEKSLFN